MKKVISLLHEFCHSCGSRNPKRLNALDPRLPAGRHGFRGDDGRGNHLVQQALIIILFLLAIPNSLYAIALPTAPMDDIPNEVGQGSVNPYIKFSQNEYIDLSNGLLTFNPKGLQVQLGTLPLDVSPSYHPNRGRFGTGEFIFSSFHALAYPSVDRAVYTLGIQNFSSNEKPPIDPHTEIDAAKGEGELSPEFRNFPLGDLGYFSVNRFAQVSRAAFKVNDKKWLFGVNGIVGAMGAEIEVGDQGDTVTVFMLIKSDGAPVFISTVDKEKGFRKKYKLLGDHRFSRERFVVQDSDGVRYTFASNDGFRSAGNYRGYADGRPAAWESRIETRKCYKILGLFGDCDPHLNFPGWKGKPFFLQKIEDQYGNEIRITSRSVDVNGDGVDDKRISIITTGKAVVEFIEGNGQVVVRSGLDLDSAASHPVREWTYNLDGEGNVVSIKDPDGNVTRYEYLAGDRHATVSAGQVFGSIEADAVVKVRNPLGGVVQFDSYYGAALRGTVVTENDPGSFGTIQKTVFLAPLTTTIFDYDGGTTYYDFEMFEGVRRLKEKRMNVNGKLIQETYAWQDDPSGGLIYGTSKITNTLDGQSFIKENTYDQHGRLVGSRDGSGEYIGYTYFCDDIPEDKRIVSHQVKTVKRTKERLQEDGTVVPDAIELEVKPFFPIQCETQTIYKRLEGLEIDISFSDLFSFLLGDFTPLETDVMNYVHNEVETDTVRELVVSKIEEVIKILNGDAFLSQAVLPPMTITDFNGRYNQAAKEYIDNFNAQSVAEGGTQARRRCTYYGGMIPPENREEEGYRVAECWVTLIGASPDVPAGDPANGGINEIDRFPEIQLAMNVLAQMLTERVKAVVQIVSGNITDPNYDLPYDSIYALAHDTLRSLFDLSPIKPDLPFLIGQIVMHVGGETIPLRRYLYELRPGEFNSMGDIVKGGPLLLEIDEKGSHTTYIYNYCDIAGADACTSLSEWRREQVNRQLLTAKVRGKRPAQLYSWVSGLKNFFDQLRNVPGSNFSSLISTYLSDPANQIDAELYAYDLDRDNLTLKMNTNFDGQFYQYSAANDLRQIGFLNGSYIKITPNYVPNASTVVQETMDVTTNKTLQRTQYISGSGQVIKTLDPNNLATVFQYGPNKKVSKEINPDGGITSYGYDNLGRLDRVQYPGGKEIKVSYGREQRAILGGGSAVTNAGVYSFDGQVVMRTYRDFNDKVVEIELVGENDRRLSYRYRYDTFGNLIQSAGPDGSESKYILDRFSRIEKIVYPDGTKLTTSGYNNFNRPAQITFSKPSQEDISLNVTYDPNGRVTKVGYPNGNGDISFTYDQAVGMIAGVPTPRFGNNRITSVTDESGTSEFFYTPGGSATTVIRAINDIAGGHFLNPADKTVANLFVKDGFSNTKGVVYGGNRPIVADYGTDSAGRLSRVNTIPPIVAGTGGIASYRYDEKGKVSSIAYANGITSYFAYRPDDRIESIRLEKSNKNIFMETYRYDGRGNKTSITYLDGSSVEYNYALPGYLTTASYYKPNEVMPYSQQEYSYDNDGNRISYKDGDRRIDYVYAGGVLDYYTTGKTKVDYTYDRWGNVSKEEETYNSKGVITKDFTYDSKGNLRTVKVNDLKSGEIKEINYKYDYKDRREVKQIVGFDTTFYFYDKEGGLLSEWKQKDGTAGKHRDYIYAGGMPIATVTGYEPRFIHYDDLGTPRWFTDRIGRVVEANTYDPFGNVSMHLGSSFSGMRFQGAIFDEETGLYYMGGSYYEPMIGRFISKTRASGGYGFAASNPLNDISIVQLMSSPAPEASPFFGVTGGDRLFDNVAASAKEGTDDFGGSGFICVESDISTSVEFLEIFDTDASTNVRGCIDSTTPFGAIGGALGGQLEGEATAELKQQAINGIIKDMAWKTGLMAGAGIGIIVGLAANPIAGAAVAGAIAIGGAIFYAFVGNWTEFKAFFGFVDYVYMDHPPSSFKGTNMRANNTNRTLVDPGEYVELTRLANLGADSLNVLSGLAEFGVIPIFENPLAAVQPFGLRARINQPVIPYRFNGSFNGGSLLGQVF